MPEILHPQRKRRRVRRRRKKSAPTIDSIAPGRAPVGFISTVLGSVASLSADQIPEMTQDKAPEHSLSVSAHSNATDSADQNLPFTRSQCPVSTSELMGNSAGLSCSRSIGEIAKLLVIKDSNTNTNTSELSKMPAHQHLIQPLNIESGDMQFAPRSISGGLPSELKRLFSTPSCPADIVRRDSSILESLPNRLSSYRSDRSSLDPLFGSQARVAELSVAAATKARNSEREVEDINSLPSFRPISLGSLAARPPIRNKGSKAWKPLTIHDLEENKSDIMIQVASDHKVCPNSQIPLSSITIPTSRPLRKVTAVDFADGFPYQRSAEILPPLDRRLIHDIEDHLHSDRSASLACSSQIFDDPVPHHSRQFSAVSLANTGAAPVKRRLMAPQDISPAKQEEKFAMRSMHHSVSGCVNPANGSFTQQVFSPVCSMRYNTNSPMDRQHGIAESPGCPCSQKQEAMDENGDDRYVAYGSAPPSPVVYPGIFPMDHRGAQLYSQVSLSSISSTSTQTPSSTQQRVQGCHQQNRDAYSINRENTLSLTMAVNCSGFKGKTPTGQAITHERPLAHAQWGYASKLHRLISPLQPVYQSPPRAISETVTYTSVVADQPLPWSNSSALDGSAISATAPFKFPPPGLPFPKAPGCNIHLDSYSSLSLSKRARIAEINEWFHADRRGEEQLREQVADIARKYASRHNNMRTASFPNYLDSVGVQSTLLFGNVLANLQSYLGGDSKRQLANFANFDSVQDYCYEPIHGGPRSYYDLTPVVSAWKVSPHRPLVRDPPTIKDNMTSGGLQLNIRQ